MPTITYRSVKGTDLEPVEVDNNFLELSNRTNTGWQNLRGEMSFDGLSNPPTPTSYNGVYLPSYAASSVNACTVTFHLPHDFVPGSTIYPHGHFMTPTASTGDVVWTFSIMAATEYSLNEGGAIPATAAFGAPSTASVIASLLPEHKDIHLLREPDVGITIPWLAPDAVILMNVERTATSGSDTYPDPVFLFSIDLYYQSLGFGTTAR